MCKIRKPLKIIYLFKKIANLLSEKIKKGSLLPGGILFPYRRIATTTGISDSITVCF